MSRGWLVWAALLAGIVLFAAFVPWLALPNPVNVAPLEQFAPPTFSHWIGTDQFGRDVLSRTVWGARTTLLAAGIATLWAVVFGAALGISAGAAGGWVDWSLMRLVDILLVLPGILIALVLVAILGANTESLALGVGISLAPGFSRLVRASVIAVKQQPYIEASRALGAGIRHIIFKHLLPHVFGEILAFAVVLYSWAIMNTAALEFLGVAGSPSTPRLGRMLFEGREYLRAAPWIALAPGLALMATVVAITRLSDAWRQRLGRHA